MTHEEMVAELISRYPHRKEELKQLDELLVYRDDEGVYGFVFDTCLINEIFIAVAEYDFHECDKDIAPSLRSEGTMANTDTIHSVALVYAQRTGKEPQITNYLIRSMQNDLSQLATEYAVNDTDNFFKGGE